MKTPKKPAIRTEQRKKRQADALKANLKRRKDAAKDKPKTPADSPSD
jgi:hypothetical protein